MAGLAIYFVTDGVSKFSQGGVFTAPFLETLDGRVGGSVERLFYVRNDDALSSFTDIFLQPVDTAGTSIVDGTSGFAWKLRAGSTQPTEEEWKVITAANKISLVDIGTSSVSDTSTYLPFWIRVEVPRNTSIKTYTDVQLINTANQITV